MSAVLPIGVRISTLIHTRHAPHLEIESRLRKYIHGQLAARFSTARGFRQPHWNCQPFRSMSSSSGRIHVLGLGNIGRLFAHELAIQPNPPSITLLLHRSGLLEEWGNAGKKIEITTEGATSTSSHYDVELVEDGSQQPGQEKTIENLIVATKTLNTVKALSSVKHRLTCNSTVLFTQNGMGIIEEVTDALFPNPSSRPQYLASVTSHGVYTLGPFRSVHAGLANVTIGRATLSEHPQFISSSKSQYLIDKIINAPGLAAKETGPQELTCLQLEKLVINAMINPLTTIFDCKNGELFNRDPILHLMRLLLAEASQVIQLFHDSETASRFSTKSLEIIVLDVADKTAKNTSSMLQDRRAGRPTEIDYINGYIVKRGKELGVECNINEKLMQLVKEGKVIGEEDKKSEFELASWLLSVFGIFA